MIYLITDWMNNVCFDSYDKAYDHIDDASDYLDRMVEEELASDGINPLQATEKEYTDYRGEYSIEEYDESIDRIMWTGTRYVLKKDYYKGIQ
jgi:hypothetical protein